MVLKLRTTECPLVASKKSIVIGSISEKSQDVLPSFGGSNSATPSRGYGSQGTNARSQPQDRVAFGMRCRAPGFPCEAGDLPPPVKSGLSWIPVLTCPNGLQFGREHFAPGIVLWQRTSAKEQAATEINQGAS